MCKIGNNKFSIFLYGKEIEIKPEMKPSMALTLKINFNYSLRQISSILNFPVSTIKYNFDKLFDTGTFDRRKGSGRKRKTTEAQDDFIINLALPSNIIKDNENDNGKKQYDNTHIDIQTINNVLKIHKINICNNTIRNRLKERKAKFGYQPSTHILTPKQKRDRLEFALKYINTDWSKWLFTDESSIQLGYFKRKGWYFHGTNKQYNGSVLSYHIWGAINLYQKQIHCYPDTLDALFYLDILEEKVLPQLAVIDDLIFQDDNSGVHRAKIVKKWKEDIILESVKWPACSPDLNPIENVWKLVKEKVWKLRPTTKESLKESILNAWDSIPLETIQNIILSMNKRLQDVIDNNGDYTKY